MPSRAARPSCDGPPARQASLLRAFSLTELLVALTIVLVLIAVLLPALRGAREAARAAKCTSNLHQVAVAAQSYVNEQRRLPLHPVLNLVRLMELPDELWVCPSNIEDIDGVRFQSYAYPAAVFDFRIAPRPGVDMVRWDLVTRAYELNQRLPLVQDFLPYHTYRNVAGFDGGVTQDHEVGLEVVVSDPH